ncbi:response regulator transcription factor [Streptomyces albus]
MPSGTRPAAAARCARTVRPSPPGGGGAATVPNELSPREEEVARLVALGRTNREIAEVLFLSPRTVEQHVARVLRKLNVTSRDQVAVLRPAGQDPTAAGHGAAPG